MSFDIKRYLGRWYEQGSTPAWFSKGCKVTTATYELRDDGVVDVQNACIVNGKLKESRGKAKRTNDPNLFKVSFFFPALRGNYRIAYVSDDYKEAIVTSGKLAWILTRKSQISESEYKRLITKAQSLGIDINNVRRTDSGD